MQCGYHHAALSGILCSSRPSVAILMLTSKAVPVTANDRGTVNRVQPVDDIADGVPCFYAKPNLTSGASARNKDAFEPTKDAFAAPSGGIDGSKDALVRPSDAFLATGDALALPSDAFVATRDGLALPSDVFAATRVGLALPSDAFVATRDDVALPSDAFVATRDGLALTSGDIVVTEEVLRDDRRGSDTILRSSCCPFQGPY